MVAEQLASAGKVSMPVSAPRPPLMMSPAKEKLKERNIVGRAESLAKNKCFPTHYCCKVNNYY